MRTSDSTPIMAFYDADAHCEELHNLSNRRLWMLFREVENVVENNSKYYQAISEELVKRNQFKPDCRWSLPH